jgi:hypothetical protein
MTDVVADSKLVDFTGLKERYLCQFKGILSSNESGHGNILCYAGICWLS